jgi:hypothetical protein
VPWRANLASLVLGDFALVVRGLFWRDILIQIGGGLRVGFVGPFFNAKEAGGGKGAYGRLAAYHARSR